MLTGAEPHQTVRVPTGRDEASPTEARLEQADLDDAPARRWAVALDTGHLVFVDSHQLVTE